MQHSPTPRSGTTRFHKFWPFGVLTVIGLFFLFAYTQGQKNIENADVGDCTSYKAGSKTPYKIGDCDDDKTQYKVIGIVPIAGGTTCGRVAGTTHTVTSKQGRLCMIEKNDDPQMGINTIEVGDCMNLAGDKAAKIDCSNPAAGYIVLKRSEGVSKVNPGSRCVDEPDTVKYYGWGIEQVGGTKYRITSTGFDRFFCLGRNNPELAPADI